MPGMIAGSMNAQWIGLTSKVFSLARKPIVPLEKCKLFRKFAALREGNVLYWSVVWQATGVGGEILQVDATHFYPHWQTKSLDVFKKINI